MSDERKQAVLKGIVDAKLIELMTKTTGDQVYLDNTTTVSAKISEMISAINQRAKIKDVTIQLEELKQLIDEALENTVSHNLIPFTYYGTDTDEMDVEWTVNEDGTVMASGTATGAPSKFTIQNPYDNKIVLEPGEYTLSGCPQGGSKTTYHLGVAKTTGSSTSGATATFAIDYGDGVTFTLDKEMSVGILATVYKDYAASDLIFKPMLVKGNIPKEYTKGFDSVYELSKKVDELITYVTDHEEVTNDIQTTISTLGTLAKKNTVSESDLDSTLKAKINTASSGNNIHVTDTEPTDMIAGDLYFIITD